MHVLFIRGRCKIEKRRKTAVFFPFSFFRPKDRNTSKWRMKSLSIKHTNIHIAMKSARFLPYNIILLNSPLDVWDKNNTFTNNWQKPYYLIKYYAMNSVSTLLRDNETCIQLRNKLFLVKYYNSKAYKQVKTMRNRNIWDVMLNSLVEVYQSFKKCMASVIILHSHYHHNPKIKKLKQFTKVVTLHEYCRTDAVNFINERLLLWEIRRSRGWGDAWPTHTSHSDKKKKKHTHHSGPFQRAPKITVTHTGTNIFSKSGMHVTRI